MSTTFDESKVRRGQPDNAGKFASKSSSLPKSGLLPSNGAPVVPYEGQPVAARIGAPAEVTHGEGMAMDEAQVGTVSHFAEEHRLEDGTYLTSVHYAYVVGRQQEVADPDDDDAEPAPHVVVETEQFVSDEQGAYEKYGHLDRQPGAQSTFTRQVSDYPSASIEEGQKAAERALEDVWSYQVAFNRDPFSGSFDEDKAADFADALPSIRAAYGMR